LDEASDGHNTFTILLRLDATFVMAPRTQHLHQTGRTGRAPGFEAQTVIPVCLVVLKSKSPKPSISAWLTHDHLDIDACPVFAYLTRPTPSSSIHILLLFSVPCGSSVHPDSSISQSKPTHVRHPPPLIHRHEPFARPSPHSSTATSHPVPRHHEPRDIRCTQHC